MFLLTRALCIVIFITNFSVYSESPPKPNDDTPLFLTPYIEQGKIQEAQKAAEVEPLLENIKSYSGFLTVNNVHNSNLFFWFFPAEVDHAKAPLVIWLQGGPGDSSLLGIFDEHGPFYINNTDNTLVKREYYWSKTMNVLYIDNPVGTGFSFTEQEEGYARNQEDVGLNLYKGVVQFLKLFPEYLSNDLYLTGESYGGKYVPALAYSIYKHGNADLKINLKGMAMGNAWSDQLTGIYFADVMEQLGLIDSNTRKEFEHIETKIKDLIRSEQYEQATEEVDRYILGMYSNGNTLYKNKTGLHYYYNYINDKEDYSYDLVKKFVTTDTIRNRLHTGKNRFGNAEKVLQHLKADMTRSVKPWFEELLEHYRIILYTGQLDLCVPYQAILKFIHSMKWSGAEKYKTAERKLWHVDGELAGYSKTVGNFTEILVRNAGHLVAVDQPKWAYDLAHRFTNNISF